jgi:catechol 2,3-dioxygenase-like lactoylglutathione lyase family enzyme
MLVAMALHSLDHVNLRTANLARMRAFYCDLLGLRDGERPPFSFGGAWLYSGQQAVVHLVEVGEQPAPSGELRLEHFAFLARDFDGMVRKLSEVGVEFRVSKLLGSSTRQLNIHDPDGNRIHLDFPVFPEED